MISNLAVLSMAMAYGLGDFTAQIDADNRNFLDNYSVYKILGSAGPYSPRRSSGINPNPPKGLTLDQVVMFHRHGERFPDEDNSQEYEASLAKLADVTDTPSGYEFLHSWTYYANSSNFGLETSAGKYSGIDGSKQQGERYLERYSSLLSTDPLKIWASDSNRVNATAYAFADGFFHGRDDLYSVDVIPEEEYANSLTPKCKGPDDTSCEGETTRTPEFDAAADRLNADLGTKLNASDIENLMYVGLYEINVRGNSPWLDVFTPEEWIALEYIRSYRLFCKRAHGSPKGLASGSILSNATAALLSQGPGDVVQNLTFAFVHDTQISQIIGAAGLLNQTNDFDADRVTFGNQIDISDVVPMGAGLSFERYTDGTDQYVRVFLNEAVLPIDWCSSGPGYSCPLDQFVEGIQSRFDNFGWTNNCKLRDDDDPEVFTIFWE